MGVNLVSYIEGGTQTEAYENRGLMTVYGPKGDEVTVDWQYYTVRSFIICTLYQILLG
jgi:hypothetical protein